MEKAEETVLPAQRWSRRQKENGSTTLGQYLDDLIIVEVVSLVYDEQLSLEVGRQKLEVVSGDEKVLGPLVEVRVKEGEGTGKPAIKLSQPLSNERSWSDHRDRVGPPESP